MQIEDPPAVSFDLNADAVLEAIQSGSFLRVQVWGPKRYRATLVRRTLKSAVEHEPVARYYELLRQAHEASESADRFDVVSTNPESRAIFAKLCDISASAQLELITHIRNHELLDVQD